MKAKLLYPVYRLCHLTLSVLFGIVDKGINKYDEYYLERRGIVQFFWNNACAFINYYEGL